MEFRYSKRILPADEPAPSQQFPSDPFASRIPVPVILSATSQMLPPVGPRALPPPPVPPLKLIVPSTTIKFVACNLTALHPPTALPPFPRLTGAVAFP